MTQKFKIDGISMFARVYEADDFYNPPKYVVNLVVDDATKEKLVKMGLKPQTVRGEPKSFEGFDGPVFKFTTKHKPRVVDSQGNLVECDIGNGSKIRCYGIACPYDNKFGKGVTGLFDTIQIIDLVEYTGPIDTVAGGFVANTPKDMDNEEVI